jgi:transcriptional regulator with XRE-family HTH domain
VRDRRGRSEAETDSGPGRRSVDLTDARAISGRLRTLIKAAGSQARFAERVGVGRTTVTGWLAPKPRSPDPRQLVAIAVSCGVNLNWLLLGQGNQDRGPDRSRRELGEDLVAWLRTQLDAQSHAVPGAYKLLGYYGMDLAPDAVLDTLVRHYGEQQRQLHRIAEQVLEGDEGGSRALRPRSRTGGHRSRT